MNPRPVLGTSAHPNPGLVSRPVSPCAERLFASERLLEYNSDSQRKEALYTASIISYNLPFQSEEFKSW